MSRPLELQLTRVTQKVFFPVDLQDLLISPKLSVDANVYFPWTEKCSHTLASLSVSTALFMTKQRVSTQSPLCVLFELSGNDRGGFILTVMQSLKY